MSSDNGQVCPQAGYGRVLVRPFDQDEMSVRGIVVPGGSDGLVRGEVVSVGTPDERYGERECPYAPGDIVAYIRGHKSKDPKQPDKMLAYLYIENGTEYESVLQVEVIARVGDTSKFTHSKVGTAGG